MGVQYYNIRVTRVVSLFLQVLCLHLNLLNLFSQLLGLIMLKKHNRDYLNT